MLSHSTCYYGSCPQVAREDIATYYLLHLYEPFFWSYRVQCWQDVLMRIYVTAAQWQGNAGRLSGCFCFCHVKFTGFCETPKKYCLSTVSLTWGPILRDSEHTNIEGILIAEELPLSIASSIFSRIADYSLIFLLGSYNSRRSRCDSISRVCSALWRVEFKNHSMYRSVQTNVLSSLS